MWYKLQVIKEISFLRFKKSLCNALDLKVWTGFVQIWFIGIILIFFTHNLGVGLIRSNFKISNEVYLIFLKFSLNRPKQNILIATSSKMLVWDLIAQNSIHLFCNNFLWIIQINDPNQCAKSLVYNTERKA